MNKTVESSTFCGSVLDFLADSAIAYAILTAIFLIITLIANAALQVSSASFVRSLGICCSSSAEIALFLVALTWIRRTSTDQVA